MSLFDSGGNAIFIKLESPGGVSETLCSSWNEWILIVVWCLLYGGYNE